MKMKQSRPRITCICVGATGSGKTLLLRKLQQKSEINETTSSVPTVGTSMYKIKLPNNKSLVVRELGGVVAPLWHHYYNSVEKIIFVVDASNLCQISASGVLLYSLLTEPALKKSKILLVLSKMDMSYRQMRNEALLMLQIEKLKTQISQTITIAEFSAIDGTGNDKIFAWLQT
ncbi:ADP-ribosylation factor-like protein 16 [Planococcus citri]|uniref:ADP-ribosylation factor-like protein 16 n=1 Tax=Planococcus citri TaxID=170843 RepID=UPI0031F72711